MYSLEEEHLHCVHCDRCAKIARNHQLFIMSQQPKNILIDSNMTLLHKIEGHFQEGLHRRGLKAEKGCFWVAGKLVTIKQDDIHP